MSGDLSGDLSGDSVGDLERVLEGGLREDWVALLMILNYICIDIFQMIFGIFSILGTLYCELGLRKIFVKLKKIGL